jgi:hypothetical protein
MRRIFSDGRYANVTATLALVLALTGTSYAALTITGRDIKNGSVKSRDLGKSSVTSAKVKDRSLLRKDFRSGQLPRGPRGAKGDKGDQGDPGSARAYGLITGTNGFVSLGKNLSSANVNRIAAGAYCITGLGFSAQQVQATLESPNLTNTAVEAGIGVGPSSCPAGTQVRVFTRSVTGVLADHNFFLLLN